MLKITIKPITHWNGKETIEPRYSQFRQTYRDTIKILEKELSYLEIRSDSLAIEMFVHPNQIRADGQLRADAKPYKQGVKLSFDLIVERLEKIPETNRQKVRVSPVTYPCDKFNNWQDNLRAIALSLEALRKVERYGVLKFKEVVERLALPSAEGKLSSRDEAFEFIAKHSAYSAGLISQNTEALRQAYRQAAIALHPDKNDSDTTDDFLKLQDSKRILGL